jgi:zinc transport system substrate-binding protein
MKIKHLVIFIAIAVITGCGTNFVNNDKPLITVSILPQKYLLKKIGGDRYEINVMVPPGMNPATYDPSPRQLQQLNRSIAYLRIGHIGFEKAWMKKISSINSKMPVFDLSSGVMLIEDEHNSPSGDDVKTADPHIWLSPKALKVISLNICNALIEIMPSDSAVYRHNYYLFLQELDSLDKNIGKSLSGLSKKKFIIYHPALTYLARDYGLQQIPVEYEGKSPSPFYFQELINMAKNENIKAIFIQEQFDTENAKVISDEIDGKLIIINPLDEDLLNQIQYITDNLVRNLSSSTKQ